MADNQLRDAAEAFIGKDSSLTRTINERHRSIIRSISAIRWSRLLPQPMIDSNSMLVFALDLQSCFNPVLLAPIIIAHVCLTQRRQFTGSVF
jgi:hypothetical protein